MEGRFAPPAQPLPQRRASPRAPRPPLDGSAAWGHPPGPPPLSRNRGRCASRHPPERAPSRRSALPWSRARHADPPRAHARARAVPYRSQ